MAEYIERKAAIKVVAENDYEGYATWAIKAVPAADVVPVVRCKDCRHRDPEDYKCDCGQPERQGCPFRVDDNYFCAYGES